MKNATQATQNAQAAPNNASDKKGHNGIALDLAAAKAALAKLQIGRAHV